MEHRGPRVLTIAPTANFLETLAEAVLSGFPHQPREAPDLLTELPRWTILVPTRRSARELERIFRDKLGPRGGLLPAIRPIGDIDEDLLAHGPEAIASLPGISDAISPLGRELVLITLIDEWATENPQSLLAREIANAPGQALALAQSLAAFVDSIETEEIAAGDMSSLYDLEQAQHREDVLGFLSLARLRLPALLRNWKLSGPKERQSRVIRHEARRLRDNPPRWPVIAAGSTGTIPATRELLLAIANCPAGAVILPGLDLDLDSESWDAAGPQHPQYALKQLLSAFAMERHQVDSLGETKWSARHWLMTEFMRPPEGSAAWSEVLASAAHDRAEAARGLTLVEAGDREEEALAIALMLRESCEISGRTACLITPDRDLARRVKQELSRWSIAIDDTAGQPLIGFAGPTLLALLMDAVESGHAMAPLHALLRHPLVTLGLDPPLARRAASLLDLALFRRGTGWPALGELEAALTRNHAEIAGDPHAHHAFRQFAEADWAMAEVFLRAAVSALHRLANFSATSLAGHLDALQEALEAFAGPVLWSDEPGAALLKLLDALKAESSYAGICDAGRAMAVVRHHLATDVLRPSRGQSPRLAIYGLLEARLMRADLHILGGLNEGVWPALPDSGPWLNRPMREKLHMPLPEKAIGQTAHDLVQAMGAEEVHLVWSRRIGDKPAIPSRWVLRLNLLLDGVLPVETPSWLRWARQLRHVDEASPCSKPKPCPPVGARPATISVTQVENLIRDPYGFYAKRILKLEPLPDIAAAPGYALRGTLYHEAIGKFLAQHPHAFPDDALDQLLAIGLEVFAPHFDIPLISAFWWPRFQRIAHWIATEDRSDIAATHAEVSGAHNFNAAGKSFKLTGRADRIDVLASGEVEIVDYKTGKVPSGPQVRSGLSPQLPLEAAMVMHGAFKMIGKRQINRLLYVRITGGEPPAKVNEPDLKQPVAGLATHSLECLRELLASYANPQQAYPPRHIVEKEDDVLDHDHLSRHLEWRLSGRLER